MTKYVHDALAATRIKTIQANKVDMPRTGREHECFKSSRSCVEIWTPKSTSKQVQAVVKGKSGYLIIAVVCVSLFCL